MIHVFSTTAASDDDFLLYPENSFEYDNIYQQQQQRKEDQRFAQSAAPLRSMGTSLSNDRIFHSAMKTAVSGIEFDLIGDSTDSNASGRIENGIIHFADSPWMTLEASSTLNSAVADADEAVLDVWTPSVVFRVATISVLIVLTLVGNALLIAVIVGQPSLRRKRVSVFLVNLAVGDLMVCFVTMTTEILFVAFGEWVLGAIACKLIVYGQIVTLASTTFLLTAMSIDRYQVIVQPLRSLGGTGNVWRKLVPSWALALLFALPQLFIFVQVEDFIAVPVGQTTTAMSGDECSRSPETHVATALQYSSATTMVALGRRTYACKSSGYTAEWQRKMYLTYMTLYILIIPTIIMTVCYAGIIRVVWLRATSTADSVIGNSFVGNGSACGDRPKIHFVSSKKATGAGPAGATDRHYATSQLLQCGARSNRYMGTTDRLDHRQHHAGSIQIASSTRINSTARLQAVILSKRNVVKMTLSVIVGFVACWTPYFVVSLIRVYSDYGIRIDAALSVSELMAMAHSSLNPLIYMLFSRRALAIYCSQLRRRFCTCTFGSRLTASLQYLRCCGCPDVSAATTNTAGSRPIDVNAVANGVNVNTREAAVPAVDNASGNSRSATRHRRSAGQQRSCSGDGAQKVARLTVDDSWTGRCRPDVPVIGGSLHTGLGGRNYRMTSASARVVAELPSSTLPHQPFSSIWFGSSGHRCALSTNDANPEPCSSTSSCSGCGGRRPRSAPCFYRSVSSPSNSAVLYVGGASTFAVTDAELPSATFNNGTRTRWHVCVASEAGHSKSTNVRKKGGSAMSAHQLYAAERYS